MKSDVVVIIAAFKPSLYLFRRDLISSIALSGFKVTAMAGNDVPSDSDINGSIAADFIGYPVSRTGLSIKEDIFTCFALFRSLLNLRPSIVLAYTVKPIIWGGLALWLIRKPQFYALVTGLGYAFQPGADRLLLTRLVSLLYRLSLMRAEKVIFQNQDNLEEFVNRGIVSRSKCERVFGSGVDLNRYTFKPLPKSGMFFLGIGRLLGDKGLREYAQAARKVKTFYPEARFQWLGAPDSSPDGIPLEQVLSWQAEGILEYLGETDDVRPFLEICQVFVLPSYHEGMPRSTLEAMAMGRPVLTTDVSGCRDTVIQDENGFLVPKADPEALAERMIWFIEHRERWQAMGEASRRIAEDRFDVHKVNADMLRIMGLNAHA
jgi:glycosyltransferase involved in cell wall biosynthesis